MTSALLDLRQAIGYTAGVLATAAFLPQVIKTLREKSVKDISLGMYVLFCAGVGLWLLYGVLISSWPIIISNFVTLILSGTVLVLKIKNG
jgi:MtN3 and saliva related transmembrane protein